MAGKLASLIEAACMFAAPMQGNGHDAVCIFKERRSPRSHQDREWPSERLTPLILQSVNDLSQRALVLPDCTRTIDRAMRLGALRAQASDRGFGIVDQGLVLDCQWVAAPVADGRCNRPD